MRTITTILIAGLALALARPAAAACPDGCCSRDEQPYLGGTNSCPQDCPAITQDYPENDCGDGCLGIGEICDWGTYASDVMPDHCRNDCRFAYCGDHATDTGEECDDGYGDNGDGCDDNCTFTACGNGVLTPSAGEQCDDGNLIDGDGCDSNCTPTACGNGVVSPGTGESCDDGNASDDDACKTSCSNVFRCCIPNFCGDQSLNQDLEDGAPAEVCDDGWFYEGTGSDGSCRYDCGQDLDDCGNQYLDPGEVCDFGILNTWEPDAVCRPDCQAARCGDGVVDTGEACDREEGCGPECQWL